ncbi:MAG: CNP1-like family protein [Gammaproteobacteria bacterium]|nr:CNP1-like family protein [Gammaproteobacteria bacterium]
MRTPSLLLLLVTLLPGMSGAAAAYENDYDEPAPWTEDVKPVPAPPQEADLIRLAVDGPQRNFKHYIDSKSLTTHADGVVTYTAVIASDSGAQNILFEGIRCEMARYKTYAYGNGAGGFQQSLASSWQKILTRSGPTNYRSELLRYYLCDERGLPLQPHVIIERLKHPNPPRYTG